MTTSSRTRVSLGLLAAALALALGFGLLSGPGASGEGASGAARPCTKAELAELRAVGDNFVGRCLLPGRDWTGLERVEAAADQGEVDRSANVRQIARVPLKGAFAAEDAFGTDLAFQGRYAFGGNYQGFAVYDVRRPSKPRRVAQVVCPGGQNDVSVHRNLLVLSVDSSRSDDSCRSEAQSASIKSSWEGIRVFDISNPRKPRYVAAVETDCGSHTHTLAPARNGTSVFVYVSSYGPASDLPDCRPPHDRISVVKVPVRKPERARVVAKPRLFPDGGNPGSGVPLLGVSETSGCHDITAYPAKDLAAGACMGDGILLDIKQRARPRVIHRVTDDANFAFWHSATFNNRGTKVVFTDELGGGSLPTCNPLTGPTRGADGIYDIVKRKLVFRSYFKIPRTQGATENCVAHNGSLIPVKGRDVMVQAWYQGGFSVFDFTDSTKPTEIAHFDRGAISETEMTLGGAWSTYWYNGRIYSNDITRGLEVFRLDDPRTRSALKVRMRGLNAQSQARYRG
ncbi:MULTISPECIES: LVIVD repeat-containing protein [unclassified Nocardioides]|uniref:LVIVD repeat-containing protein n=1 Tax=unclassified Nocardioides TaxID=2615069 RepID=UPI003014D1E8